MSKHEFCEKLHVDIIYALERVAERKVVESSFERKRMQGNEVNRK